MALGKFGARDWFGGFLVSLAGGNGKNDVYVPAITLVDSGGSSIPNAPFTPIDPSVSIAVTGTSGRVALTTGGAQVVVSSASTNAIAFIKFGDGTVTATTASTPILPGTVQVFTPPAGTLDVAAIGTSSTTLYFTTGAGA